MPLLFLLFSWGSLFGVSPIMVLVNTDIFGCAVTACLWRIGRERGGKSQGYFGIMLGYSIGVIVEIHCH